MFKITKVIQHQSASTMAHDRRHFGIAEHEAGHRNAGLKAKILHLKIAAPY